MAHIAIISQLHPCTNPRPVKEANTLAEHGHRVSYITNLFAPGLDELDSSVLDPRIDLIPATDLRENRCSPLERLATKFRRRLASELVARFGIETPSALCHSPHRLVRSAEKLRADLYIGHIEGGIHAGRELQKRGHNVAFDIEDWHSNDGLPATQSKFPRRLVARLEHEALRSGTYVSTTSFPMAHALAGESGSATPHVIYNVFPFADRDTEPGLPAPEENSKPSLIWFSQNIAPGRGIELLIDAVSLLPQPVQVHLLGKVTPSYHQEIQARFPSSKGHTLTFHQILPKKQLVPTLMRFDIGLATEPTTPANKNLTISNKIFHYLQAGLAVVATGTEGQRSLAAEAPGAVAISEPGTPQSLADSIARLISDSERLKAAKSAAENIARTRYCWELESKKFINLVDQALSQKPCAN